MCGICGELGGRPVERDRLAAMTGALRHRGPDADGYYYEDAAGLGLGHRRLKVIDLEGGVQPMSDPSGKNWLAFNGEIYNFLELRAELEKRGHVFRTRSDTEVILHQYIEDGPDCVRRFNGMFAFALWDGEKRRLMLARDRLGVKPLYYCREKSKFIFSSEIKSLLIGLNEKHDVDPAALYAYLALQYVPSPRTIFKGICKLPPGSIMLVQDGREQLSSYWSLPEGQPPLEGDAAVAEVRRLLEDAVRLRLVADVPLGAFLSGGLDSTLVVAMMRRQMGAGLKTFSVDFAGGPGAEAFNETRWSQLASAHFQTEHHPLTVGADDLIAALPTVAERLDDPVADPAAVPTYLVSRLARQQVTVALTGEGSDELFGGYLRYALAGLARWYRPLPCALREGAAEKLAAHLPRGRRVRKALAALGAETPALRHLAWVSVFSADSLEALLGGASGREWLEELFARAFAGQSVVYSLEKTLRADISGWLPDDLLIKVDRMSMAVGLEARTPYLDYRLVEAAFRIPDGEKVRGREGKLVLKRAAQGIIPAAIIARPKAGFTLPLDAWFRRELRPLLLESLAPERLGGFSAAPVRRLVEDHLAGRENNGQQLWSLLIYQLWRDKITSPC